MDHLVWFNISVLYSATSAAFAVVVESQTKRLALTFLAVHGALWSVYRAVALVVREYNGLPK